MSQNGLVNQNVGRNGNSKEHAEFSDKNEGAIGNWTKKSPMLHDKKKKTCFYSLGFNSCLKTVWQAIFKEGGLVWQGVFKTTKCLDCSLGAIGCCTYIFSKNKKQKKA